MSEPDVTKGRKRRGRRRAGTVTEHRSRRVIVYENLNRPRVCDPSAAVPHFGDDPGDFDDGVAEPDQEGEKWMTGGLGGGHASGGGFDVPQAMMAARPARAKAVTDSSVPSSRHPVPGNPVPPATGTRSRFDRVSPSRVTGRQAEAVDDHGTGVDPMNVPGPKRLALGHPDMQFGTTRAVPLFSGMRTAAGDNQYHDKDITYVPGQVGMTCLMPTTRAVLRPSARNRASIRSRGERITSRRRTRPEPTVLTRWPIRSCMRSA